jgi:hypothetical protein
MVGSKEEDHNLQQSPCTRGIIQYFKRQVKLHTDGLENDMQVRNDKIGQLEAMQIATNTKLMGLETMLSNIDKSLAALLRHFDELHAKTNEQCDHWEDEYIVDTKQDERDARRRRRLCTNRRGMGSFRRHEVHNIDDAFNKIKFKIHPFDGTYVPDAYITRKIVVDQKFACHDFPKNARVRAATSEFTDFASVWWIEHGKKNTDNMPQTWDALKQVMWAKFVPSYYAHNLLHKLQQLR